MFNKKYTDSITIGNILATWEQFLRGKKQRKDVMLFQSNLTENISELFLELRNQTYMHGSYVAFNVSDPKPRIIHKALVRDRVVHHLIYKTLYFYFDERFIHDSYSCRKEKGTHRALDRFNTFARKSSQNYTRTCYVLKCDIRKFFANIDHGVLIQILQRHIADKDMLWLIEQVIQSFCSGVEGVGLPLGNLTSQLLVNVYMHEFDMYVKQELKVKYYIRYADDFVILSDSKTRLENLLVKIDLFLNQKLHLSLHKDKTYIKTYASGIDFLGWIHFPRYRQLRTSTKRRVMKNMRYYPKPETINSYRGILNHGNTHNLKKEMGLV